MKNQVLYVEIGNTRTKCYYHGTIHSFNNCEVEDSLSNSELYWDIDQVYLVSVALDDYTNQFIHLLRLRNPNIAYRKIINSDLYRFLDKYDLDSINGLGIDRLLRLYHILKSNPNHVNMSIGFGTAFTIEVFDANSLLESRIAPGLEMSLFSLSNLALLPKIKVEEVPDILSNPSKTYSTKYSIVAGVVDGYVAMVNQLIAQYNINRVYITGSSANLIRNYLSQYNPTCASVVHDCQELLALKQLVEDRII